jgi:hypothetical protein
MVRCAAVKKKGSVNQCAANAVFGHSFCGTHARAKSAQIWKDVQLVDLRVVKCQAIARGWILRQHLRLAGPGVLNRKDLANDDDLLTCEEATKQHPLSYFAFNENGKVWWFDFATIWVWSLKSFEPVNPYTRTPLTPETRKRLKEMWHYRIRNGYPIPQDPAEVDERMRIRWNFLCQTFIDNGFVDVTPSQFLRLSKSSHVAMWRFMLEDVENTKGPYKAWCNYMLSPELLRANSPSYIVNSLRVLMRYVGRCKDPYVIIFSVMSAIYRC